MIVFLLIAVAILIVAAVAPMVVFYGVIALGAVGVLGGTVYGLTALCQCQLDKRANDREEPVEGVALPRATSRAWLVAVLAGDPLADQQVKRHDVRKALRRRYGRKRAKGSAS